MNAHLIEARFISPTNTRGARIKLTSFRFPGDSITDGYPYSGAYSGDIHDQAKSMLKELGYTLICSGESDVGYILAVKEFAPLKTARLAMAKGGAK